MLKHKSKELYSPVIHLRRFTKKNILIISVIFFSLLNSSPSHGQELIPFLKGQWTGTALYQANSAGFTSSDDSIDLNISEQSFLKFNGNAKSKTNGKMTLWVFEGYLDEECRNICLINQSNKKILVGNMIIKRDDIIIKLYSWDDENNRIIIYILRKIAPSGN
jgi:hypothetical protein